MKKKHKTVFCKCGHNMMIHNNKNGGCQYGRGMARGEPFCKCKVQG